MNRVSYKKFVLAFKDKHPKAKLWRTKYGVIIRYTKVGVSYNYRGSLYKIAERLELNINN